MLGSAVLQELGEALIELDLETSDIQIFPVNLCHKIMPGGRLSSIGFIPTH